MSSDKSYVDQAKEAVGAAQQKASEALGSAKDTVMGTVSVFCYSWHSDHSCLSDILQMVFLIVGELNPACA